MQNFVRFFPLLSNTRKEHWFL